MQVEDALHTWRSRRMPTSAANRLRLGGESLTVLRYSEAGAAPVGCVVSCTGKPDFA